MENNLPSFDLEFCYLPPPSPLSFLEKRKKGREKEKRTSALSVRVAVPSPRHGVTDERVRLLVGCSALCLTWWSWAGRVRRGSSNKVDNICNNVVSQFLKNLKSCGNILKEGIVQLSKKMREWGRPPPTPPPS